MADRRGPKIGDAASLWNFTPSPGWTKEELHILKLCLMRFGVGQWLAILNTGLLPGKLIQQLNGQTQRMLGQQSLAAYSGLKVDIDTIRADNEKRKDVLRKGGLIIYQGPTPNRETKQQWHREAKEKYGLSEERLREVEEQLEELQERLVTHVGGEGMQTKSAQLPPVNLMEASPKGLQRDMKLQLLRRLQDRLVLVMGRLVAQVPAAKAAAGAQVAALKEASLRRSLGRQSRRQGKAARPRPAARGAAKPAKKKKRSSGGSKPKSRLRFSSSAVDEHAAATAAEGTRKRKDRGASKKVEVAAFEADISQLQAMGFSRTAAMEALVEADNDMDTALELLCG